MPVVRSERQEGQLVILRSIIVPRWHMTLDMRIVDCSARGE